MAAMIDEAAVAQQSGFRQVLFAAPLRPFQILAIAIITLLCALDSIDVFAITFAAPGIEHELGIGKAALGIVFSSGLIGMALGSLLLAPAADLYGRRKLVILSLLLMVGGTLWTASASTVPTIALSRLLTGFGIGAMIATINPLAAEYANARSRDFVLTLLNMGFPVGGMIGGLLAAQLLPTHGWRALFLVAGAIAAVLLVIVISLLPEPVVGILAQRNAATLDRLNRYLDRCGQPPLAVLPDAAPADRRAFRLLIARGEIGNTLRITAIYFLYVCAVFFIQTWLPTMVAQLGFSPSAAALVSTMMNLSGVIGGLLLSILVARIGLKPMVLFFFLLSPVAILLFGFAAPELAWLHAVAVVVGVATIGGMVNLYAVVSRSFPAAARASGTGVVVGIGRFGSAIGPGAAGLLFAHGYDRIGVSLIMAIPAIVAAILLAGARLRNFG